MIKCQFRNQYLQRWIPVSYTHLDVYKRQVYNGSKDDNEPGTVNAIRFEAHMFLDGDKDTRFAVAKDNTSVSVVGGNSADIYVVGATNYVDYLNLDNTKMCIRDSPKVDD